MAEPATQRMTLDAFLAWDGEPDVRYQLFAGVPEAMAPANILHQALASRLTAALSGALSSRPDCSVIGEVGVTSALRDNSFYVADVAVTCKPLHSAQTIPEPVLIVEVLSPSTEETDRKVKLGDYRAMPSVEEILLIDPNRLYAEVHRRFDAHRWLTDLLRQESDVLHFRSVGLSITLADLYRGFPALGAG
jgi:Uma2 family endonuclease